MELFNVWDAIDEKFDRDVPEEVKALARGYVAGLNLYAAENPDEVWPGLLPFKVEDIFAGSMFRTPFFYGLDGTLLELYEDERKASLSLDPAVGKGAWLVGPKEDPPRGSNAFAVSPERSGDGTTRLFINSHQPMTGPSRGGKHIWSLRKGWIFREVSSGLATYPAWLQPPSRLGQHSEQA